MDVSRVHTGSVGSRRCQPGNRSTLLDESVGYLLMRNGSGTIELNHRNVRYHFGIHNTDPAAAANVSRTLAQQCNSTRNLNGFNSAPILVAKKITRNGGHGSWLRRCRLSRTNFSAVNDEDIYTGNDRTHLNETIAFALLKIKVLCLCITLSLTTPVTH